MAFGKMMERQKKNLLNKTLMCRRCLCFFFFLSPHHTGDCMTTRRGTAANSVANTSRTACGYACTCCVTQVEYQRKSFSSYELSRFCLGVR